jgi:hypothetical protein
MSSINFPLNPTLNQTYSFADRSWIWNGRAWRTVNTFVGFTGSQGIPGEFAGVGFTGSRGFVGSQGAGFTGSRGNTGFTGSQGIPGEAANIGFTGSSAPAHVNLYQSGPLEITSGATRWYAPYDLLISNIFTRVVTPANSAIIIGIKINDQPQFTITITANSTEAPAYTTPFPLNFGDFLTVSVNQTGSSIQPGANLYVQFRYSFLSV